MLKIRKAQMDFFSNYMIKHFENRMVIHLNKFFPEQCNALGEPNIRDTIQYGIQRARAYGIISERDVCLYIDVMMMVGRDFDTDAAYPWAQAILNDQTVPSPSMRIDQLYDKAVSYQSGLSGRGSGPGVQS